MPSRKPAPSEAEEDPYTPARLRPPQGVRSASHPEICSPAQASIWSTNPAVSPRSKCHASKYSPYFDSSSSGYSPTLHIPRTRFSGRMNHTSSGITYAATKSNEFFLYGPLLSFKVQEYPFPSGKIVDFTCTRIIFPPAGYATQSYPDDSPQGRARRKPSCSARTPKHNSAHSPRFLQFLILIPKFFFIAPLERSR